jgi:hypothetical protein
VGVTAGLRVAGAVLRRPRLWSTAVRQIARLTPDGWWRRRPFLPVPDAAYLRFRSTTQYGGTGRPPTHEDVLDYLAWCREWDRALRP